MNSSIYKYFRKTLHLTYLTVVWIRLSRYSYLKQISYVLRHTSTWNKDIQSTLSLYTLQGKKLISDSEDLRILYEGSGGD